MTHRARDARGTGDEVTITATLRTAGATGTVQFLLTGDPLGSPVAIRRHPRRLAGAALAWICLPPGLP